MSYEFFILLKFLGNVMRTTHSLTVHLQSQGLDILSSIDIIGSTLKLIQIMRNDDQSLINILTVRRIKRIVDSVFSIYLF